MQGVSWVAASGWMVEERGEEKRSREGCVRVFVSWLPPVRVLGLGGRPRERERRSGEKTPPFVQS